MDDTEIAMVGALVFFMVAGAALSLEMGVVASLACGAAATGVAVVDLGRE